MLSKSQIKNVRQLYLKKYRDEAGLFIAEGPKLVNELLNSKYKVSNIYATKEFQVSVSGLGVKEVTEKELEQISILTSPNEVVGVFEIPSSLVPAPLSVASELVLALDDIRDPGNFGTIIRIADWFGINHILCSETCVDLFNSKVIQATMGSIARVEVHYVNIASFMDEVRGQMADVKIYGATMNGKSIYAEKFSERGIIIIGNESKGISEALMKYVTNKISIPNFGKADSLNAAIATAVICSEFRRT